MNFSLLIISNLLTLGSAACGKAEELRASQGRARQWLALIYDKQTFYENFARAHEQEKFSKKITKPMFIIFKGLAL